MTQTAITPSQKYPAIFGQPQTDTLIRPHDLERKQAALDLTNGQFRHLSASDPIVQTQLIPLIANYTNSKPTHLSSHDHIIKFNVVLADLTGDPINANGMKMIANLNPGREEIFFLDDPWLYNLHNNHIDPDHQTRAAMHRARNPSLFQADMLEGAQHLLKIAGLENPDILTLGQPSDRCALLISINQNVIEVAPSSSGKTVNWTQDGEPVIIEVFARKLQTALQHTNKPRNKPKKQPSWNIQQFAEHLNIYHADAERWARAYRGQYPAPAAIKADISEPLGALRLLVSEVKHVERAMEYRKKNKTSMQKSLLRTAQTTGNLEIETPIGTLRQRPDHLYYVEDELARRIEALAMAQNKSAAEILRAALEAHLSPAATNPQLDRIEAAIQRTLEHTTQHTGSLQTLQSLLEASPDVAKQLEAILARPQSSLDQLRGMFNLRRTP